MSKGFRGQTITALLREGGAIPWLESLGQGSTLHPVDSARIGAWLALPERAASCEDPGPLAASLQAALPAQRYRGGAPVSGLIKSGGKVPTLRSQGCCPAGTQPAAVRARMHSTFSTPWRRRGPWALLGRRRTDRARRGEAVVVPHAADDRCVELGSATPDRRSSRSIRRTIVDGFYRAGPPPARRAEAAGPGRGRPGQADPELWRTAPHRERLIPVAGTYGRERGTKACAGLQVQVSTNHAAAGGALLFAQVALAAHACAMPRTDAGPERGVVEAGHVAVNAADRAECMGHCRAAAQHGDDKPLPLPTPAWTSAVLCKLVRTNAESAEVPAEQRALPLRAADPPHAILHRCRRI